jgi:hypothetical protein
MPHVNYSFGCKSNRNIFTGHGGAFYRYRAVLGEIESPRQAFDICAAARRSFAVIRDQF